MTKIIFLIEKKYFPYFKTETHKKCTLKKIIKQFQICKKSYNKLKTKKGKNIKTKCTKKT